LRIRAEGRRFSVKPGKEAKEKQKNLYEEWRKESHILFERVKAVSMKNSFYSIHLSPPGALLLMSLFFAPQKVIPDSGEWKRFIDGSLPFSRIWDDSCFITHYAH
jgi:hypothetical protein